VRRALVACGVVGSMLAMARTSSAHHEALFGPQSSLAVESPAFASAQVHTRATGVEGARGQETTFLVSAGIAPLSRLPWTWTLVQPFTYQTTDRPTPDSGPFTSCDGCLRRENVLLATSWRFDFDALQRQTDKDGNFALVTGALELPTGNKDYAAFDGPWNAIVASIVGFEVGAWSTALLGYYRIDRADSNGSKKGNSGLAGVGFAWTPIDEKSRMISVQLGVAEEAHARDVLAGQTIASSGGHEIFVSPTLVLSFVEHVRFFALVSIPVAQKYESDADRDRYRAGIGVVYSWSRQAPVAATTVTHGSL
jgi:hypothetical protein